MFILYFVEIYEKSSHNGEFYYELMMISDNGLLFGPPCIDTTTSLTWGHK